MYMDFLDVCQGTPCQNNGICVRETNRYHCHCTDGFTGAECEFGKILELTTIFCAIDFTIVKNYTTLLFSSIWLLCLQTHALVFLVRTQDDVT